MSLPFAFMSKNPGIGFNYLSTHSKYHTDAKRYYSKQNGIYARLPRFFKDKMFTREQRLDMAESAEYDANKIYHEDVKKLSAFHEDPYAYYAERRIQQHDTMTKTINSKDKF